MSARLICGTFNAESHWRPSSLASLPSLQSSPFQVIERMDEMLFLLCEPGDRLLTARSIAEPLVDYLHQIGFAFTANAFNVLEEDEAARGEGKAGRSLFAYGEGHCSTSMLRDYVAGANRLEAWAVLKESSEFAERLSITIELPSYDVVQTVNAKSYSSMMRDRLGLTNIATLVSNPDEFLAAGYLMLKSGPFLIKDEYGVSGGGNLLVQSEAILQRLARHLEKQCLAGSSLRFILEPLVSKQQDFSGRLFISSDGKISLLGIKEMKNNGFAFQAMQTPSPFLSQTLVQQRYFEIIHKVGEELFVDGYFGEACIDSMLLTSGDIEPIVEINARKSMSSLHHAMQEYLLHYDLAGELTHIVAAPSRHVSAEELLDSLEASGLLFKQNCMHGVIPINIGTLLYDPSAQLEETSRALPGRLYVILVHNEEPARGRLLAATMKLLEKLGFRVMNHSTAVR